MPVALLSDGLQDQVVLARASNLLAQRRQSRCGAAAYRSPCVEDFSINLPNNVSRSAAASFFAWARPISSSSTRRLCIAGSSNSSISRSNDGETPSSDSRRHRLQKPPGRTGRQLIRADAVADPFDAPDGRRAVPKTPDPMRSGSAAVRFRFRQRLTGRLERGRARGRPPPQRCRQTPPQIQLVEPEPPGQPLHDLVSWIRASPRVDSLNRGAFATIERSFSTARPAP